MDYHSQLRQQLAKARKEASGNGLTRDRNAVNTLDALLDPIKDEQYQETREEHPEGHAYIIAAAVNLMARKGVLDVDGRTAGEIPA